MCVGGRGVSSCEVWASQRTGHLEGLRIQTRLDSGIPDFPKKANSCLGQKGVLQIIQEPRVLGMNINRVLRPSEDHLSSHTAPLLLPGSRKELRPRPSSSLGKNSDPGCLSLARADVFGGRQGSEPKSSHWGQASLPSIQLSQVTLIS